MRVSWWAKAPSHKPREDNMRNQGYIRLSWKNREEDLRKVPRYSDMSTIMYYRSTLLMHTQRVEALLESSLPLACKAYPEFDAVKARLIARHHDDYELQPKIGDVSLQLKLAMNGDERKELKKREIAAAHAMAKTYPKKVEGYNYLQLLLHAIHKDCMEAQLVSVVDKNDGYGEALHELLAGNNMFSQPVVNYHLDTFADLPGNYPLIRDLFPNVHPLLSNPLFDVSDYYGRGNKPPIPHTPETVARITRIPRYEEWKAITIKMFGLEALVTRTEFHNLSNPLA